MKNGIPSGYSSLISSWLKPQTSLTEVIRWKKYLKKGKGAREQSSLQHSLSITIVGGLLIWKLSAYIKLDAMLLMTALAIHDVGEGRTGDTHYIDKNERGDLGVQSILFLALPAMSCLLSNHLLSNGLELPGWD